MNYKATLCTGKKVVARELITDDEELALKALGQVDMQKDPSVMKQFVQEMMKMMIVEIDDQPTNYQQLSEKNWSDLFTVKETRQLESMYNHLHVPSPKEDTDFLLTIKPVSTVK